jgi:Metallopeptidase family M24
MALDRYVHTEYSVRTSVAWNECTREESQEAALHLSVLFLVDASQSLIQIIRALLAFLFSSSRVACFRFFFHALDDLSQTFHTNPNILHYRNNEPNGQMAPGHTFTIEPMICEGSAKALTWPDNWTATTVDGKRSAQFEHTLLVTAGSGGGGSSVGGVQALTGKKDSSPVQFWELESKIHSGVWLGTSPEARQRAEEINQKLKSAQ